MKYNFGGGSQSGSLVKVDQHVDDLAQCAVRRQTAVIKHMAEIITFDCDRLSLVISPRRPHVAPTLRPRQAAGARDQCWCHEKDPRLGCRYGWRFKTFGGSDEETPVQGRETQQNGCHPTSHQKSDQPPQHQHLAIRQFVGHGYCASHHTPCVPNLVGVLRPVLPLVSHNADPDVQAPIECVQQWLVFWHIAD